MVARKQPNRAPAYLPDQSQGSEQKRKGDPLTAARLSWLEQCGRESKITGSELRLAIRLALAYAGGSKSRAMFEQNGVPVAFPSQTTLGAELNMTRQGVSAVARRIAKRGLLEIQPGLGRAKFTQYRLIEKSKEPACLFQPEQRQRAGIKKANSRVRNGNPGSQKRQASSLPDSLSLESIDQFHSESMSKEIDFEAGVSAVKKANGRDHPEFDELFDLWPNKNMDRGKALGAWINNVLKKSIDPARVLKRAEQWAAFWRRKNGRFIPYLGKWLAERSWEKGPPVSQMDAYLNMLDKAKSKLIVDDADDDQSYYRRHNYIADPDAFD